MSLGNTEEEAKNRAKLWVENMLQRPDQLQKVDQYKRRVQRKKLSVEAMLKTAMQSQLDGVRTGLNQLQTALSDLKEIKSDLSDIEQSLVKVPELNKNLQLCREENVKHSQYAAAMENLKHIFTVPDSIEKTKQYIADGKLLNAHQCITDLENSRDDLLFELHKLPNQNQNETRLLKEYFGHVQSLSEELGKQLWLILQRNLNTVRKEPTQIVTALRIIEREERSDQFALSRHKSSGFKPVDRPKEWKKKCFEVLEEVVSQRIEGNQFENRSTNKNWLIRHLEVIRMMLLEDFKVIRSQCVPCFPAHYDILNTYVHLYHKNLSLHLVECVDGGLEDNEMVTVLSWVINTYTSEDLMGHPGLGIDVNKLGNLLDNKILEDLKAQYVETVKKNYIAWMTKALELEEREWTRPEPPQQDGEAHYKTELPHLLHDMMKQNLDVAATISSEVQSEVLITSLEQAKLFANKYKDAILRYKDSYFADRSKIPYFTTYMIALANSCQAIMEVMITVKEQFWRPGNVPLIDNQVARNFDALKNTYINLRNTVCECLMEEALVDLQEHFNCLITPKWITDVGPMDTICLTLKDYFQDYTHLHHKNFEFMVEIVLVNVCNRYITAILLKKLTLRTEEDRRKVAKRIHEDADELQNELEGFAPEIFKLDSPCEAIKCLAEVIKVSDMDFLGLEIHRLLRRYPDVTSDHLTALLLLRGDISRLDVRQTVIGSLEEAKNQKTGPTPPKTIFSNIVIQSSILFP